MRRATAILGKLRIVMEIRDETDEEVFEKVKASMAKAILALDDPKKIKMEILE